ncbi:MAG TPA: HAD-IIIA family hydrolase [Thermodesulfobacteriota bacterium]|nr:HAD-IIIA family hydrolase [Thermodesulfobacteriota bacterium]
MKATWHEKAKKIRLLVLDVDGVLTDGAIIYSDNGGESKSFNVKDGLGIKMLTQEGIKVAIISGRNSRAVEYRAKDLGIQEVYQGIKDKVAVFDEILKKNKINPEEIGFMGDDLIDLPLLYRVGFAIGVSDAAREIKNAVDYVTKLPGGKGAVREVCELILKSQKKWKRCLKPLQ